VPRALRWFAGSVAITGAVALMQPMAPSPAALMAVALYFIAMLTYSALAFGKEATRAAGVSATRLRFTAIGTWLHAMIAVLYGLNAFGLSIAGELLALRRLLGVLMFGCYYAGLVAPRALRSAWARRALYDYFRQATSRSLEHRVANAAADLEDAAGRVVASDARAVLLFGPGNPDELVAQAVSPTGSAGLRVRPADGLVGQAIKERRVVIDSPSRCEGSLSAWADGFGTQVMVAPIPGANACWGVLVAVHRYGSLFPDDDAELVELLARLTGLTLEHGRLVVAERDADRQAFQERLTQVQRLQSFGQLASGTAHDFNNLLTAVYGYLHVIETHPHYHAALDDSVAGIKTILERATGLTDRLLSLSRRQRTDRRVVDLSNVVAEQQPVLDRVLEGAIAVTITRAPGPVRVVADPVQIGQILINLALNARDAMADGGRLTISVTSIELDAARHVGATVLAAGRYARLAVSDTGVGMDAATRARIFEPFFTTKAAGRGTGLGLPTVNGIVTEMGGAVGVDSAPGFGATFDLYFPIASSSSVTSAAAGTIHRLDERRKRN
jgi:signal transduction histidine kinase